MNHQSNIPHLAIILTLRDTIMVLDVLIKDYEPLMFLEHY